MRGHICNKKAIITIYRMFLTAIRHTLTDLDSDNRNVPTGMT